MKYIYSVEGVTGLYRGVGMKILSNAVGTYVYESVNLVTETKNKAYF